MASRALRWTLGAALVVTVTYGVLSLTSQLIGARPGFDARPYLLLAGLVGLNCITYFVWFNRWNIAAHTSLAFAIVAYVIPIVFLGQMQGLSSAAVDLYYQVVGAGLLLGVLGVVLGGMLAGAIDIDRIRRRACFENERVLATVRRRTMLLGTLSVLGVGGAFAGMGFIPILTPDPLTAKFFRGAYAAAYQPVAPLYRGSTSILAVLLPVIFLYSFKLKSARAAVLAGAATVALFAGLMREPAVSGILLLLGVAMAVHRRSWFLYFAFIVSGYFLGGSLYYLLALLGIGGFGGSSSAGGANLLVQAASGAPDIRDQITFLTAWLQRPEYTHGLTWFGGLIPGNNPWNPSVWSLRVVNPTQEITAIASGGLRLPPPVWGLVSFGWPGVVFVSLMTGLIQGYLAGAAKRIIPTSSVEASLYWQVLYLGLVEVLPAFFRFSYLSVLQLLVLILVFCWRTDATSALAARAASSKPRVGKLTPKSST